MHKLISAFITGFIILAVNADSFSQENYDSIRYEDRIRILEARTISDQLNDMIWKRWSSAPFALLLVTNENEYLMFHEKPSEDFKLIGNDTMLNTDIYIRPRQFSNNFLATFPAVGGVPTVVVGIPENTSRGSNDWVNTLLHEHFHQIQSSDPEYYEAVNNLDLSGDDNTGMWMLNYDFPYDDPAVSAQYSVLTISAREAVEAISDENFESKFRTYLTEREKFKAMLDTNDYKYFSFQIWQEGIARYTELKVAETLAENYEPSDEFRSLEDYMSFDSFYVHVREKQLRRAESQVLSNDKRNCFYTLGALEGLILDRRSPGWRDEYFTKKFFIEEYYK